MKWSNPWLDTQQASPKPWFSCTLWDGGWYQEVQLRSPTMQVYWFGLQSTSDFPSPTTWSQPPSLLASTEARFIEVHQKSLLACHILSQQFSQTHIPRSAILRNPWLPKIVSSPNHMPRLLLACCTTLWTAHLSWHFLMVGTSAQMAYASVLVSVTHISFKKKEKMNRIGNYAGNLFR